MLIPAKFTRLYDAIVRFVDAAIATNDFDTIRTAYQSDAFRNACGTLKFESRVYQIEVGEQYDRFVAAIRALGSTKYGNIEHHVVKGQATADDVLRGTVLSCSWGYDQTNVDYYVVVKRTPKMVTYLPMTMTETPDSIMTGTALPGTVQYEADPIRRSIRETPYGVRINGESNFQSCDVWNGRAKYVSHYH